MTIKRSFEEIEVISKQDLVDWLGRNYKSKESFWLVTWKKSSGANYVSRIEILEALLSYGWIDSLPRKLDEQRTMLLISRRKEGSSWSKINRDIIARLIGNGDITEAGLELVEAAKKDGSWSRLQEIEELCIPQDLDKALSSYESARKFFDNFPPSSKRGILEWIQAAKQPETREKRIRETAEKAARNVKANHPKGRDTGPKLK